MATHTLPREAPVVEWSAPQYPHIERDTKWYITAAVVVGFCILYSLFTQAWSFTLVIILVTGLYWYTHREPPRARHLQIWESGYACDGKFVPWSDCNGYWMLKGPDYNELHIERKRSADLVIQTGDLDADTVHHVLQAVLPEHSNRRENIFDIIIRLCKL